MGNFEAIDGETRRHSWGFSRPLMGNFEANGGKIDEINGQFRGH